MFPFTNLRCMHHTYKEYMEDIQSVVLPICVLAMALAVCKHCSGYWVYGHTQPCSTKFLGNWFWLDMKRHQAFFPKTFSGHLWLRIGMRSHALQCMKN